MIDDLVDGSDNSPSCDGKYWISQCASAVDEKIGKSKSQPRIASPSDPAVAHKLKTLQHSVDYLPLRRLSKQPLYDMLKGFEMDLSFNARQGQFPIHSEKELDLYASRVASTVATLVLDLVCDHHRSLNSAQLNVVKQAGVSMGKGLQCVNIARDIGRDAAIQRVYIPTSWLGAVDLSPAQVIQNPESQKVHRMQQKMLDLADNYYKESRAAIEVLPIETRGPIRTTVES